MDDSRILHRDGSDGPPVRFRAPGSPAQTAGGDALTGDTPHLERSISELSGADLFGILWLGLADILGTAAAATLLRRAAQRARPRWPDLAALEIARESLEYRYTLPSSWDEPGSHAPEALSALARELWPLLVDLTGTVVVQRLAQIPELRQRGILPIDEAPP
jgi:hypothetical protein